MGATYRNEGLSVGSDHMRLYGEEIQLEVSFHDLILGNRIGQGACSSVNLAKHKRTAETYAIKMFNVYDKGQASQLYNEILLLTSFQCDALISLKGAFHDEGSIGVILEYMDRGSLEFLCDDRLEVSEQVMAAIAFQICWGLGYLHYEKQIHRDVKPGNMLMNSLGQVKLSDFGISKELDNTVAMSHTSVGSYRYMSPERLKGEKYDGAGDVWSVGITIIELWSKSYPFKHVADTPISLLGELEKNNLPRILGSYSRSFKAFLLSSLEMNPHDRAGAGELMGSDWIAGFEVENLDDAQLIVSSWLHASRTKKAPPPAANGNGRPPRKDANEMSISMESSRSSAVSNNSVSISGASAPGASDKSASASVSSSASASASGDFSISRELSRELSRDRMQLSNNPFTSSGSFRHEDLNGSLNNSMGSMHNGSSSSMGSVGMGNSASGMSGAAGVAAQNAASRYRMAYDIGQAPAEEYEEDFEDETVERYDEHEQDRHGSRSG
eukprot:CAMPEP_0173207488 /NCGR_PEP_ID=MMETSP1141-20130122/21960_1 /TAXON_ID=483371 /ORGANISM="non described non described, Strain CCMP2298" /LENGTH=497 /DNA_ID=CAMNT_0014133777 /DNA_START=160 /DNA_END=1650 /DNA_ORIENTATION=-